MLHRAKNEALPWSSSPCETRLLDIKLKSQPPNIAMLDIKSAVTTQTKIPTDKLKLLYKKKPVSDSKVLKDLAGENETEIEVSVMVLGGAAAIQPEKESDVAVGPSGSSILETNEFWVDLHGFLQQRIKDAAQAEELSNLFKKTWESTKAQ